MKRIEILLRDIVELILLSNLWTEIAISLMSKCVFALRKQREMMLQGLV